MKQLFQYLVNSSVAQKKADWNEFINVCDDAKRAGRCASHARDAISRTSDAQDILKHRACIVYMFLFSLTDSQYYYREYLCDCLRDTGGDTCAPDCPMLAKKNEYLDKVQIYQEAKKRRRNFWKNKIQDFARGNVK